MVDLFVAPSPAIAAEFERLGLSAGRLEVSDYGFPVVATSRRQAIEDAPLRIGFVGTLVWHKGVHILLEAARALTGRFEIHLHGDTTVFPDYVHRLRGLASGQPVTFHGGFDRDRVASIYGSLDVLVVPSLWPENSPLVIHEAFMFGVAVIGSRTGGIPHLVRHDVDGLVYDPFSAEGLAAALQSLVDEPARAARLAGAAPVVKSIAADAREWTERYTKVTTESKGAKEGAKEG